MLSPARFPLVLPLLLLSLLVAAGCDSTVDLDTSGELVKEDLTVGDGEVAESGDRIVIESVGKLPNGTVFDDSHRNDGPYVIQLGEDQVIPGWEQGIPGMREGGTRRLTIPPRLAYGTRSNNIVPANSTVVFEIELLQVDHPDSLGIQIITEGTGDEAVLGSDLTVHYIGTLVTGQTFDSSIARNDPYTLTLGETSVIEGWTLGLRGMREGEVRRLVIPPALAYGEGGRGSIPPNATLVFQVRLIDVADE